MDKERVKGLVVEAMVKVAEMEYAEKDVNKRAVLAVEFERLESFLNDLEREAEVLRKVINKDIKPKWDGCYTSYMGWGYGGFGSPVGGWPETPGNRWY